jgi:GT2 family glycosyltransferase
VKLHVVDPGKPAEVPRVTVAVVSFNTRAATLACLESVLATGIAGLQVVVVDNASTDGTPHAIASRFPQIRLVLVAENLGFAKAVNVAASEAEPGYLVLLNPDTIVLPGSLEALLEFALRHPEYRMYGGRTLRSDGSLDPSSCWGSPSLWSLTCYATGLSTAFKGSTVFDPESLGRWQRNSVRTVPVITGCLLLISVHDFQSLGGMDERFFLYGEDAEFSLRARSSGIRPVIVPDALIIHDSGGSTGGGGIKMCMVMAGKATYLRVTWSKRRAGVGVALLQAGSLLRSILERACRRPGMWSEVWRRRSDWRSGYPAALARLFDGPNPVADGVREAG